MARPGAALWTTAWPVDDDRRRSGFLPNVGGVSHDGLQVQTDVLREAGFALSAVLGELEAAPELTDPGSDVIAHRALRDQLQHVGSGWRRARTETIASIDGLGKAAVDAAETYERLDTELARWLWAS